MGGVGARASTIVHKSRKHACGTRIYLSAYGVTEAGLHFGFLSILGLAPLANFP
jgi:hypothetical protein